MPTEDRGSIGQVKPTGWETIRYDGIVDGNYLYNRCHLIGYQLTGENANEENLITGTRSMNVVGMLPFENMIDDYVEDTLNHVYYKVTPIFEGNNLVATGVLMEAKSVEDNGDGLMFNVFCYNAQPAISIDYATGASIYTGEYMEVISEIIIDENLNPQLLPFTENNSSYDTITFILNIDSQKIHYPTCRYVTTMKDENKQTSNQPLEFLETENYTICSVCF